MIIPAHCLKVREKKIKDHPFQNGIALLINLLHQTNGCILPTLLKIELMFLEKIIKNCKCIFSFGLVSYFGKEHGPTFENT